MDFLLVSVFFPLDWPIFPIGFAYFLYNETALMELVLGIGKGSPQLGCGCRAFLARAFLIQN